MPPLDAPSRRRFVQQSAAALSPLALAHAQISPVSLNALRTFVDKFVQQEAIPGLSIAVGWRGNLVYHEGYGAADVSNRQPVTPATLFRIASLSKPITSTAIFTLIEQGRLTLDDFVFGSKGVFGSQFGLPSRSRYLEDIRLVHLLTHTSGGWRNDNTDPMFQHRSMNHRELIEWTLANLVLANPPGRQYAYSNFGYCLLGRVIETITRQAYADYVQQAVFAKAGITDMRIGGNTLAERLPNETVYYGQGMQDPYGMNVRRMDSHGGWVSTAADLVRFANHATGLAKLGSIILTPATLRTMVTPTTVNTHYAKGWAVNEVPNWWHSGSLPGTTTVLVRTARQFAWAALANTRPTDKELGARLDAMLWRMMRQVREWPV